jgi:NADH:ubiquinone oxidoreductase subunit D
MDQSEIKIKAQKIEEIYERYIGKMNELKNEQSRILEEFLHELEKAKMEEIRSKLNN